MLSSLPMYKQIQVLTLGEATKPRKMLMRMFRRPGIPKPFAAGTPSTVKELKMTSLWLWHKFNYKNKYLTAY